MTESSKLPPADLSSSFGSRARGLGGLRKASSPTKPAQKKAPSRARQEPQAPPRPPAATPGRPTAARRPEQEILRQVTVYVSPDLRDQVRAERQRELSKQQVRTNASVVLDAVERVVLDEALDRLAQAEQAASVTSSGGGLFHHRDRQVRPVGAQLPMRISEHDRNILDQLAEKHCEGNRSRLIELALRHRYPSN